MTFELVALFFVRLTAKMALIWGGLTEKDHDPMQQRDLTDSRPPTGEQNHED